MSDKISSELLQNIDSTDADIITNVLISLFTGLALLIAFMVIRPHFKGLYSPLVDSDVNWLKQVYSMPDKILLARVGLDAYVFVQTLKLLVIVSCVLAVPLLLVLAPVFKATGPSELSVRAQYYKASILHCPKKYFSIVLLVCFICTFLVYYLVFVFFKRYVVLRQAHLKDPSAVTSALTLRHLVGMTGSVTEARSLCSVQTRAVLVDGVSSEYTEKKLLTTLLTVTGDIESVLFAKSSKELLKLVKDRNNALKNLEQDIQQFFRNARASAISDMELDLANDMDRQKLLNILLNPEFYPEFRPILDQTDAISFHYFQILELEKALYSSDRSLDTNAGGDTEMDRGHAESKVSDPETQTETQDLSLLPVHSLLAVKDNFQTLHLTRSTKSQMAIVLTKTSQSATLLSSVLLSRRPFSLETVQAPSPSDMHYNNLEMGKAERKTRYWTGMVLFIVLNMSFMPLIALLTQLSSLDKIAGYIPGISGLLGEYPRVRNAVQGFLAPLAMNIAFSLAPKVILLIAKWQGYLSHTDVQVTLLEQYTLFLFLQAFLVTTISTTALDIVNGSGRQKILEKLKKVLPSKGPLFFNMFIQKAFLSIPGKLLRPLKLLKFKIKGETKKVQSLDQGKEYPGVIVYAAQAMLAFVFLVPLNILPSCIFFVLAYSYFKYSVIYNIKAKYESGGIFWMKIAQQLLVGMTLQHILLLVHFSFRKAQYAVAFMALLLMTVPVFMWFLNGAFVRRCSVLPQTSEDEVQVDKMLNDLYALQEAEIEQDPGEVSIRDLGLTVCNQPANPYDNPILFKKKYFLQVDPMLFKILNTLNRNKR